MTLRWKIRILLWIKSLYSWNVCVFMCFSAFWSRSETIRQTGARKTIGQSRAVWQSHGTTQHITQQHTTQTAQTKQWIKKFTWFDILEQKRVVFEMVKLMCVFAQRNQRKIPPCELHLSCWCVMCVWLVWIVLVLVWGENTGYTHQFSNTKWMITQNVCNTWEISTALE